MSPPFEAPGRASRSALRIFDRLTEAIAGLLLISLLASVTLGIVTRGLDAPLDWTDELARFLMVWLAMFGWIIATRRRSHVRILFFLDRLPPQARRGVETAIQAALAGVGCVAAWYGVELIGRNLDLEATSLPVSMAWLYLPLVPAGTVMALQGAAQAMAAARTVAGRA